MRTLLLSTHLAETNELQRMLATDHQISHFAVVDAHGSTTETPDLTHVDLLILDDVIGSIYSLSVIEQWCRRHPKLLVMLLSRTESTEAIVAAVGAGVREILHWPASDEQIKHVITQCLEKLEGLGHDRNGRIVSFISVKGGSGATFLASNVGFACAARLQQRVLLIDLDLQYGNLSFSLGDKTTAAHIGLLAQDDALDREFFEASCAPLRSGLSLLSSPVTDRVEHYPAPDKISSLLSLAAHSFDLVIVDLPPVIDALSAAILLQSNRIVQVMNPTVADLRNQQRQLHYLNSVGVPLAKVAVVVNKIVANPGLGEFANPITTEITQRLTHQIIGSIPFDDDLVSLAAGAGEPVLAIAERSAASGAILAIGRELCEVEPPESTRGERFKKWLLRRLDGDSK